MNPTAVISRRSTGEKLPFSSEHVFPRFSILDPTTTVSLPPGQVANGIVDTFVHVTEQYLTYPLNTPLQDRQAEAILLTLVEEAPKVRAKPDDYGVRANLMWCAAQALNSLIGCGVAQDWATHMIGHELTALHRLDHAQTLAVLLPAVLRHEKARKLDKLVQFGRRVWGIDEPDRDKAAELAIERTAQFFEDTGVPTRLAAYGLKAADCLAAAEKIDARGATLGEHSDLGKKQIEEIIALCR
jgi:NADP-dependent alcohol dehydrogenase